MDQLRLILSVQHIAILLRAFTKVNSEMAGTIIALLSVKLGLRKIICIATIWRERVDDVTHLKFKGENVRRRVQVEALSFQSSKTIDDSQL